MNCLYESVAQAYLRVRTSFFFVPAIEDDLGEAEETLEGHRASLAAREREAEMQYVASGRAALAKRKAGDLGGAKYHLQARIFFFFGFIRCFKLTRRRRRRRSASAGSPGWRSFGAGWRCWTSSSTRCTATR